MPVPTRPMTHEEAAAFLRISPSTLYQLKCPPPRFRRPGSNRWLYWLHALIAWSEGGDRESAPVAGSSTIDVDSPRPREYHKNPLFRLPTDRENAN